MKLRRAETINIHLLIITLRCGGLSHEKIELIAITGATGFIGRALVTRLVQSGAPVRCLLRPQARTPQLPRSFAVPVANADLESGHGLAAACAGARVVIHLAGNYARGTAASLMAADYRGTLQLLQAAQQAGVQRFVYLSHLGADRASAFQLLKIKGLAEEFIRQSGVPFTIVQSAPVFGTGDALPSMLAALLRLAPGVFVRPGPSDARWQPLWVQDLVHGLVAVCAERGFENRTIEIGGPEALTLNEVLAAIMAAIGVHRQIITAPLAYSRPAMRVWRTLWPQSPLAGCWLDLLAVNQACEINSMQRFFELRPARFSPNLGYLRGHSWLDDWRRLTGRRMAETQKNL